MTIAYRVKIDAVANTGLAVPAPVYLSAGKLQPIMAGQKWWARLLEPVWSYQADLPLDEQGIGGRSLPSFGVLTVGNDVRNGVGDLDGLCDRYFDGRAVTVERTLDGVTWTEIASVTTEQPTWDEGSFQFKLRDVSRLFDAKLQQTLYAGTATADLLNYEGGADLTGTPKPLVLGRCFNVEPILIDAEKRVFQVHDGRINGAGLKVRERGLDFGGSPVVVSDVYAWTAVGGAVAVDQVRGYFRLGSSPTGLVTCDVQASLPAPYFNTHAGCVLAILQRNSTLGAIDFAALATLNDEDDAEEVGLYLKGGETVGDALDICTRSMGGFWAVNARGTFTARLLGWRAPVATLVEKDFSAPLVRVDTEAPVWRYTHRADRNWRPMTASDIGDAAVSASQRGALVAPSGYASSAVLENADTRTIRPTARELEVGTLYRSHSIGLAFRVQGLLHLSRDRYTTTVRGKYEALQLGDTVTIAHPRYGLSAGKDFLVVGKSEKPAIDPEGDRVSNGRQQDDLTDLRLWGPRQGGEPIL